MGAMVLLGLWRTWPVWQALEREAVPLGSAWRRLALQEAGTWAGLGAAGAVATILGGLLLLGWPGLVEAPARWAVAAVLALLQPALHLVLQRTPAPRTLAGPLEFLAAALLVIHIIEIAVIIIVIIKYIISARAVKTLVVL